MGCLQGLLPYVDHNIPTHYFQISKHIPHHYLGSLQLSGQIVVQCSHLCHYNIEHEVHTFPGSNQCQNQYKKYHHHQEVLQSSL